jgi:hypothetical protein
MLLSILLLLMTPLAMAADVSGRWSGVVEFAGEGGRTQSAAARAELKQQGNTVAGTIGKEGGQQFDIEQGKVSGNEVSFQFRAPEGEEETVLVHSVKLTLLSPTQMQGTFEFEAGGQKASGKLTLTRDK